MKKTPLVLMALTILFASIAVASAQTNIIPKPQSIEIREGGFTFGKKSQIIYGNAEFEQTAQTVQSALKERFGLSLQTTQSAKSFKGAIVFEEVEGLGEEEYQLTISADQVTFAASTDTGIFYAAQSLMQVMDKGEKSITAQCMTIKDKPLYGWRGYMLDESRHFFGMETVKQYLDIMASLKLNRFHWHLTDEPAWRIEIKKYPKLTEIGAYGSWDDAKAPRAFYTQEQIREIVAYAADRHIMVIPEIDMPGHATAASKAYPEISGGGEGRWTGFTFHPAKEYTYEFIDNILSEVAELFPAPYIHIGADEVHFGNQSWYTDPMIQEFIKKNYLIDEVGMEHYFVRRVCEIINSKGKKMIGWDEILNTGINSKKAVVMWWRHDKPLLLSQALERGFDVIITPRIPAYFDFVQDPTHNIGRRWGDGAFNELHTVYNFPENLQKVIGRRAGQVKGIQANVWTERIADKGRLDYMTFPRLLAMAEDGWTATEAKNYDNFEARVKEFLKFLDTRGINYFNLFDKENSKEPWGPSKADVIAEG